MSFANLFVEGFFSVCSFFTTLTCWNNLYFVILFVIDANILTYLLLDLLLLHLFYSVFKVQLVGSSGLEPPTLRLSGARSSLLSYEPLTVFLPLFFAHGGDEEIRTLDPLLAGQVLSQLSYTPIPPRVFFYGIVSLPFIFYIALLRFPGRFFLSDSSQLRVSESFSIERR